MRDEFLDWMDEELEALDLQLEEGLMTVEMHREAVAVIKAEYRDQSDREEIIQSGRGHLLR